MKIPRIRIRTETLRALLLSGVLCAGAAMARPDATLEQIDQAARTGHLDEARRMMRSVLRVHPKSAKAHDVEAELLAQQNQRAEARGELAGADRLVPGLPSARPDPVHGPSRAVAEPSRLWSKSAELKAGSAPAAPGSRPWDVLIAIAGGAIAAWALMRLGKPASPPAASSGGPYPTAALSPPWPGEVAGSAPSAGLGDQLARGRAVSAGMAAAEVLGNGVLGKSGDAVREPPLPPDADLDATSGGPRNRSGLAWRDFGIRDASSWDASSDALHSGLEA